MRNRHVFRPTAMDALEDRIVMSQAGLSSSVAALVSAAQTRKLAIQAATSNHKVRLAPTVGVLGDSFSDEYRFYPPNRTEARTWVEILSTTRNLNFGQFSTKSRSEPRNQGFAFNWARSGATSSDLIRDQLPGLRAQVETGRIKYAAVFIGANDYLQFLGALSAGQIAGDQVETALEQVEARAKLNFNSAVNALLTANPKVKIVAATIADSAFFPAVRSALGSTTAGQTLLTAINQSVERFNALVRTKAVNPRIAVMDLAATASQITNSGSTTSVPFGGITIDIDTPGNEPDHLFLADGLHVGTVAQGIIASQFITAINAKFDAGIAPLFPKQIVRFAQQV